MLGSLPPEEQQRVADDIARYPELADEVAAIEDTMWLAAQAGAEAPPPALKDKIWAQLDKAAQPAPLMPGTIPLSPRTYRIGWQRAAIWIALAGSMLANFILWNQRNNTHEIQLATKAQLDTMQQQLASLQTATRRQADMLADSGMRTVVMQSMLPGHAMAATVYWNKTSGDAYLAMQKLPMPEKGKQYQMWVIKDGKPISMGTIDNSMLQTPAVSKLPMQVKDGQAFAISLEKEGGNPSPTQVYVLGKV